jgi:two-component system nitrogen regulation sensor histidine kinase NtrY
MSLRQRLVAYLIGLHLLFVALSFVLYRDTPLLLVTLEVLLLASLGGGMHLINRALEPLGYTRQFHELLQDQDYTSRLRNTHGAELGELVALYNKMLGALYQERLQIGEQQGFLDRLLEATPSAVVVFDFDGRISLLNASAQALLALDDAKGKPLSDWLEADPAHARRASLVGQLDALPLGQSRLLTDADGRRYRGQRGHFFDRGFARHFLLIEELTEELESSEKATYEKLIRVLAHEVNNTVAATGSVLESLLFYSTQLTERDSLDFSTAIVAVKRRNTSLGEFIERFTQVVKMPVPELRPAALGAMVDDILWLYREQCRSRGIEIGWAECEAVPPQAMDTQLMEQALLNIVKNAMEAVEECGLPGGRVRLALTRDEVGVRLSVSDSGNRLGALPAGQLFTPFFSTKKGGQGIGLLFVREVLNRHGFPYRLAATGHGETRFDIWFP